MTTSMAKHGHHTCEPLGSAEDDYCRLVYDGSTASQAFFAACTPGYYNNEGNVEVGKKTTSATYPKGSAGAGGIVPFIEMLRAQRVADKVFEGCEVR